jgi:dihydroorotase
MRLFHGLELPASADFHVHLRDGDMMAAVTPTIRAGGVDTTMVMVNLSIVSLNDIHLLIYYYYDSQILFLQSLRWKAPYPTSPALKL